MVETPKHNIEIIEKTFHPTWMDEDVKYVIRGVDNILPKSFYDLDLQGRLSLSCKMVEACRSCKVRNECRMPISPSNQSISPKLVVIGRCPSNEEEKCGTLFSSESKVGRLGQKFLSLLNIVPQDIYFTNSLMCHTRDDRNPTEREIRFCSYHKHYEFLSIRIPKLIVLFGYDAHQMMFNYHIPSLSNIFGQIYHIEDFYHREVYIVPLYHPGHVLCNSSLARDNVSVLQYVRNHIAYLEG